MSLIKKSYEKKLSIFIPTKGRPKFFNRLMDSLIPQLTDEVELVVSLNPPNDKYKIPKIAKVHQNRIDIGGRTNFLLGPALCTGEYIWMLGDDEQVRSGGIEEILSCLKGDPGIVVMTDGKKDLGIPLGSKWNSYSSMLDQANRNGAPWLAPMLTLASSTVSKRENFDTNLALIKTDTLYGQYYGMLSKNMFEPVHVVNKGTFISGKSDEASIYAEPSNMISDHNSSYPFVIYDIMVWINQKTGLNLPIVDAWQPFRGFDS
jgi:glycosyltransferase involved in cell wall biosynthesis